MDNYHTDGTPADSRSAGREDGQGSPGAQNPYGGSNNDPYGNGAYNGSAYTADPYAQLAGGSAGGYMQPKEKKKSKIPGIICLVLGLLCILAGLGTVFYVSETDPVQTEEPVDVYEATETDQYVFAPVQYMTESVAYYEAIDKMQFYIAFDEEWNPSVICLHDDNLPVYQPFIDWMYSESYENAPEMMTAAGYAQPFDAELEALVIEGFNVTMGDTYVDKGNFSDWFGNYYIQIGRKSSVYGVSNTGIYIMLLGVVLAVIGGALLYDRGALRLARLAGASGGPVIQESRAGWGILGALSGVLLGGLLWTVVGALGYVSGWIGLLIIFFGNTGYKILAGREGLAGKIVSLAAGVLIIIPATYLSYVWIYYQGLNESVSGYTTFFRAFAEMPGYMTNYGGWISLAGDLVKGYAFMAAAGAYWLIAYFSRRSREKKQLKSLHAAVAVNPYEVNANGGYTGNPYDEALNGYSGEAGGGNGNGGV